MSQTQSKLYERANVNGWQLDVDDSLNPQEVILWQRGVQVARVQYQPPGLNDRLVAAGMPRGTANEAFNQLIAKLEGRRLRAGRSGAVI